MALSPQTLNDLIGNKRTLESLILSKSENGTLDETTKALLFSILSLTQVAIETNIITFDSITKMYGFLKQNPGFANTLMRVKSVHMGKETMKYFINGQPLPNF